MLVVTVDVAMTRYHGHSPDSDCPSCNTDWPYSYDIRHDDQLRFLTILNKIREPILLLTCLYTFPGYICQFFHQIFPVIRTWTWGVDSSKACPTLPPLLVAGPAGSGGYGSWLTNSCKWTKSVATMQSLIRTDTFWRDHFGTTPTFSLVKTRTIFSGSAQRQKTARRGFKMAMGVSAHVATEVSQSHLQRLKIEQSRPCSHMAVTVANMTYFVCT